MKEDKCKHRFKGRLKSLCPYSVEAETTIHTSLSWHYYNMNHSAVINNLKISTILFLDLMTLGAIKKVRLSGKGKWYIKKITKIDDTGGGVGPEK